MVWIVDLVKQDGKIKYVYQITYQIDHDKITLSTCINYYALMQSIPYIHWKQT